MRSLIVRSFRTVVVYTSSCSLTQSPGYTLRKDEALQGRADSDDVPLWVSSREPEFVPTPFDRPLAQAFFIQGEMVFLLRVKRIFCPTFTKLHDRSSA